MTVTVRAAVSRASEKPEEASGPHGRRLRVESYSKRLSAFRVGRWALGIG